MAIRTIPGGWIDLRPLTGHDERSVEGTGLFDALALIDRLNCSRPGAAAGPGEAESLSAPMRDRVLASIFTQNYGDAVSSSPLCRNCGKRYDLSFPLPRMLEAYPMECPPDGIYRADDGSRFRLPTGEDELAVFGLPPDAARKELLKRCMLEGDAGPIVEAAMEKAAPLLSQEIDAVCPECGVRQTVGFDMGAYLLKKLLNDKERLPGEVHTLALAYGWGHDEILSLTRSERRRYIGLIEASFREGRGPGRIGSGKRSG